MRWPSVKFGDYRTRVVFALVPYACTDGTTRWLERVRVKERYCGVWGWELIYVEALCA